MNYIAIAKDFMSAWDHWDCIEQTAIRGLADEDRYQLLQVYDSDTSERVGAEVVRLCRERVARVTS